MEWDLRNSPGGLSALKLEETICVRQMTHMVLGKLPKVPVLEVSVDVVLISLWQGNFYSDGMPAYHMTTEVIVSVL